MRRRWVQPECNPLGGEPDFWVVDYTAHPMLDPAFPDHPSRLLRFVQMTYERIRTDEQAYRQETARLLRPPRDWSGRFDGGEADVQLTSAYLHEAGVYISSAIDLLPSQSRGRVKPLAEITRCHDLRELLDLVFKCPGAQTRFEAQRKLCLARLLLDIDHSRHIQEGPRHKGYFEELLKRALWRHTRQVNDMTIGYRMSEDGESIEYTSRPGDKR